MSLLISHSRRVDVCLLLFCSTFLSVRVHSQRHGDLRLSGYGASRLAGRLEIYLNDAWGTVCIADDKQEQTTLAAKVACRQLQLGHFIGQQGSPSLRYGVGDGSVLEIVSCHEDDLHLLRCSHSGVGVNSTCDHHRDLSITCSGLETPYEGEVRLSGGEFASEGVVEVYLNREWAPVCSTDMERGHADTVCRQMGYTGAQRPPSVQDQPPSSAGSFWQLVLSSHCSSSSQSCLKACLPPSLPSQPASTCSGDMKTWQIMCGVSVSELENKISGSAHECALNRSLNNTLRLAGNHADQGRVEVLFGDEWASLNYVMFGSEEAAVVCRELGFSNYVYFGSVFSEPNLPPPPGPQYTVECTTGLETHIASCNFFSVAELQHDDDAYVHCSTIVWPFGSLQLIGGAGPFGQLQVNPEKMFYWLCDAHFSMREANVACRQMGYSRAIMIVNNSLLHIPSTTSTTSLLNYSFQCTGDEEYLLQCERRGVSEFCRNDLDAVAVQCGSSSSTNGWRVRLTPSDTNSNQHNGSEGVSVGRVEVLLEEGGKWGTVCGDSFSDFSAHVVCRQLGFETFNQFSIGGSAASDALPVLLSSVQCTGFEDRLDYCPHSLAGRNCTHDISVNCSNHIPVPHGSLRLINTSHPAQDSPQDGCLEIIFHGLWMSICGRLFTQDAANVACRQLGFAPAANFSLSTCSDRGTHFAEYLCSGDEDSLLQCGVNIHNAGSCGQDNHVVLSCLSIDVSVVESATSSHSLPPSPNPSLPSLPSSHITGTLTQHSTSTAMPTDPVLPTEKNTFISDGIFYVVAVIICLLLLALIVAVTICCVVHKKKTEWELQTQQNGGYSDRNDEAISGGANGEMIDGESPSNFDFDGVTEAVEMKACSKAVEAMELPPDQVSLSSASLPPPYHELEHLSHSIRGGEDVKELT